MGCYPRGPAEAPETYASAVALVLSEYPESIIERVVDPRTGLPGRLRWLPAVSEVRDACEAEMRPIREESARRARYARQSTPQITSRGHRPTLAELRARYPYLAPPETESNAEPRPIPNYSDRPLTLSPAALRAIGSGENK